MNPRSAPLPRHFVLASSSPRRRELLTGMGILFTVVKPEIDERQHPDEPPLVYVERLSREKAAAAQARWQAEHARPLPPEEPVLLLAADTVVILAADTIGIVPPAADIIGKPADAEDARAMLRRLRARDHKVVTAVTMLASPTSERGAEGQARAITRLTTTRVFMRDYSDAEIEAYIATGDPFDKAGSYAIQHLGFHPVARIEGSESNVVGLPVETVREMLESLGIRL